MKPRMILPLSLLILHLSISLSSGVASDLCRTCDCVSDIPAVNNTRVKCSSRNLTIFPEAAQWPQNVHTLLLNGNNIKKVDNLEHNAQLRVLDLSNNKIEYLGPRELSKYIGLEVLDLSFNYLEKLDRMHFYGLESLKVLNISSNGFSVLPESPFSTLIGVKEIRLSNNPIESLENKEIRSLVSLETIDLSNIEAHYLPGDLFKAMKVLTKVDLSRNKFDEVPISALRSARGLQELNLEENYFNELDDKSLFNLHELKKLQLSRNQNLNIIRQDTFSTLKKLRVLEITMCPLLNYIDPKAFENLFANLQFISLTEVYLNDNGLRTLDERLLPWDHIETVNLQGNSWVCDCNLKWILNHTFEDWLKINLWCSFPLDLRGRNIMTVPNQLFICPKVIPTEGNYDHEQRILRSMTLLMAALVLFTFGLLLVLYFKRNQIKAWWAFKKRKSGAIYYVRAHSNPVDNMEEYGQKPR